MASKLWCQRWPLALSLATRAGLLPHPNQVHNLERATGRTPAARRLSGPDRRQEF